MDLREFDHSKAECDACSYIGFAGLKTQVTTLTENLRCIMYPEVFENCACTAATIISKQAESQEILRKILKRVMPEKTDEDIRTLVNQLVGSLTNIKAMLETDVQALFEGDPAATSKDEVMLAYPGFEAISIFRIAHSFYEKKVPLVPRIMTEYAHRLTGIDIHPGATIGPYFFIDHGTGVVIGETTTIGEHVKIYQGVTLGAKSFPLGDDGKPVKGIKRHPDIGNNVVIYAGATILGGETVIGDNSTIGGNVWLTHSVPANTKIINKS